MDLRGNRLDGCIPGVLQHVEIHTSLRHCYGSTSEDVADTEGPQSECSNGIVIRGVAGNPGLVKDCVALLKSREALMGSGRPTSTAEGALNWGSDVSIFEWDGVSVGGSPSRVRGLDLQQRGLTGVIPAELTNLTGLEALELQKNELMGIVPHELASLANLKLLDLSENRFTGEIPRQLGSLKELRGLRLFSNVLTGKIPMELTELANLRDLALSANRLTGEIPPGLGQLANLEELDLFGNELTGEVPVELSQLTELQSLGLASNQLTGEIPEQLGQLSPSGFPCISAAIN